MKTSDQRIMPFERGSSHPALLLLVGAVVVIATAAGIVKADVVYDRTDMTDNQTWNQVEISSITLWDNGFDRQLADDFELKDSYLITSVTADFRDYGPVDIPADGVLVEFFISETENCIGGGPPPCATEIRFAGVFSTSFTAEPLSDIGDNFHRYTVDISDAAITLDPGIWWISIVLVDESGKDSSEVPYYLLVTNGLDAGPAVHMRAGGEDHGNGYQGGTGPDWHPLAPCGGCDPTPGDAAIRIEGILVGGEPCPADLDGDGSVGVKDLLFLLGAWGPCPKKGDCPADFDNSGNVGVKDLLFLLGSWGPCR